jgi:hypothetical protein
MSKIAITSAMLLSLLTMGGAQAAAPAFVAPSNCAWQSDCSSIQGWRSNAEDPGMCAKVEQAEPSVIKISQSGDGTWGKAAVLVSGVDLEQNPMLYLHATKVEQNSAFTVQVAPADWSEFITVVPRNSAHGLHDENIRKAVKASKNPDAWKGMSSFWLVVVIEGKDKATFIDHLCIGPKK